MENDFIYKFYTRRQINLRNFIASSLRMSGQTLAVVMIWIFINTALPVKFIFTFLTVFSFPFMMSAMIILHIIHEYGQKMRDPWWKGKGQSDYQTLIDLCQKYPDIEAYRKKVIENGRVFTVKEVEAIYSYAARPISAILYAKDEC